MDDFKILNKDYLWTIATSALQEVDRQLQAERARMFCEIKALLARDSGAGVEAWSKPIYKILNQEHRTVVVFSKQYSPTDYVCGALNIFSHQAFTISRNPHQGGSGQADRHIQQKQHQHEASQRPYLTFI